MISDERYLIDTNILLRLTNPSDRQYSMVQRAVDTLLRRKARLFYLLQNLAEFWNVSTRPHEKNGLGLPPSEVERRIEFIECMMTFLPDTKRVYAYWRTLVQEYAVRGVQVHDARLAAALLAYRIPNLLTLNTSDFTRYAQIRAVHPMQLLH
jgi:predicted nucleic acid-binding protein